MLRLTQEIVEFFTKEITRLVDKLGKIQHLIGIFVNQKEIKPNPQNIIKILQVYSSIAEIRYQISSTLLSTIHSQTPSSLFNSTDVKEVEDLVIKDQRDKIHAKKLRDNPSEDLEDFKKNILFTTITENLISIPPYIIRINRWLRNQE